MLQLKTDYQQVDFSKLDNVTKKVRELQDERMRGKFDPRYHANVYAFMLEQLKDVRLKVEITLHLVHALFDSVKVTAAGFLSRDAWLATFAHLEKLLQLLDAPQMREALRASQQREASVSEDGLSSQEDALAPAGDVEKSVLPALANFMEKLDHELLKAFQNTPYTKVDYLLRLRDDNKFLFLCDAVIAFMKENNDLSKAARIAVLKLDHLYYKNDALLARIAAAAPQSDPNKPYLLNGDSSVALEELMTLVNHHGTPKMRLRAALYLVYHHSIHNRFAEAKDLLLKTHIGDVIGLQDVGSQIIYNRTLAQIGMAAFRAGRIDEAHDILLDVCQTAKLREILA